MQQRCLQVLVEKRLLAVPIDAIESIVELPLATPPPLAPAYVRGLCSRGDRIFTIVGLHSATPRFEGGKRIGRCMMIRRDKERFHWGLEVDSIGEMTTLTEIRSDEGLREAWGKHAAWVRLGRDQNGIELNVLDLAGITSHLSAVEAPAVAGA